MKHFFSYIVLLVFITSCKSPEARYPVSVKSSSYIDESIKLNKKLNTEERNFIENIIKKDTINTYISSENGFWYYYNLKAENDSLLHPNFGDKVNYTYSTKRLNGELIYSKAQQNSKNYQIDQQELFTGLREGLKLMKTGEIVTFLFPSQIAYGYYGDTNKIGSNVPLICEVTLNSITQNKN